MATRRSRERGFTLMELMIVVVIVAILAAVALPGYRDHVLKANRAVAKAKLLDIASRQESYFADNKKYADTLDALGITLSGADANSNWIDHDDADAVYVFGVSTDNGDMSFTATANSINTQTGDDERCATFSITNTGLRGATGNLGTACWE